MIELKIGDTLQHEIEAGIYNCFEIIGISDDKCHLNWIIFNNEPKTKEEILILSKDSILKRFKMKVIPSVVRDIEDD